GIASTTSSGGSGNSSRERYAVSPSTVPPVRLIRKTERRCAPSRALRASHCPHFDGSFEAPTTATDCGSKSARRSRLLPAAIRGHLRIADEWFANPRRQERSRPHPRDRAHSHVPA